MQNLVKRSDKKTFYGVLDDAGKVTFTRMKYFTTLSVSKNPEEYSRKYIDEASKRSDVVRYSPSISYSFDEFSGDSVLSDLVTIANGELVGSEAVRTILMVDFSRPVEGGYYATARAFSVVCDKEGQDSDAYTYSGTFRASGEKQEGVAKIVAPAGADPDTAEVVEFTEA